MRGPEQVEVEVEEEVEEEEEEEAKTDRTTSGLLSTTGAAAICALGVCRYVAAGGVDGETKKKKLESGFGAFPHARFRPPLPPSPFPPPFAHHRRIRRPCKVSMPTPTCASVFIALFSVSLWTREARKPAPGNFGPEFRVRCRSLCSSVLFLFFSFAFSLAGCFNAAFEEDG
jgi:hypothetical protein